MGEIQTSAQLVSLILEYHQYLEMTSLKLVGELAGVLVGMEMLEWSTA